MLKAKSGKRARNVFISASDVDEGTFHGEKVVSFHISGSNYSLIVSSESVEGNKLKVDVLSKKGDRYLIGFPGESFTSPRRVWVEKDHLELA